LAFLLQSVILINAQFWEATLINSHFCTTLLPFLLPSN
jgi:hypothetical protein